MKSNTKGKSPKQNKPKSNTKSAQGKVLDGSSPTSQIAPVQASRVRQVGKPKIQYLPKGDCKIHHREYVTDVSGSVAFAISSFRINPGLATFPWLRQIAPNWESYCFKRLKFVFETQSATSKTGTGILTVDYDSNDAAPTDKTQAMAYRGAVRGAPWQDFAFVAESEDLSKRSSYFVRSGNLAGNQDINLYDVGQLNVCTQGQADGSLIGELYVEYDIHLMTPQLGNPAAGNSLWGLYNGVSNAAPFSIVGGNIPISSSASGGTTTSVTTFIFNQPWEGLFVANLTGTGITAVASSGTATSAEQKEVIDGTAANALALYAIRAEIGQTFIITINNTTLTSTFGYFAQGDF